jgi:hypothetical protein
MFWSNFRIAAAFLLSMAMVIARVLFSSLDAKRGHEIVWYNVQIIE